jgi:hypothetical protein
MLPSTCSRTRLGSICEEAGSPLFQALIAYTCLNKITEMATILTDGGQFGAAIAMFSWNG